MSRNTVAVVGGGHAGQFAALALARAGARVTLVRGPRRTTPDPRTTALLDGSVKALETLGVMAHCRDKAAPLSTMRLVDDTKRLLRAPLFEGKASEIGLEAFGYNLTNSDLSAAFDAALAASPVTVIDQTCLSRDLTASGARLRLFSDETLEAALIVGADGRFSPLREAEGIATRTTPYPQVAITCNVATDKPHNNVSTEFHTPTGPFTLVPLPGNRVSIVCVVDPDTADRLLALSDEALAREMERRSHSLLGRMVVDSGRGSFPLAIVRAETYGRHRLALVGEAAHAIPPIGAQGLNLGLRDGAALADLVADAVTRGEDIGNEQLLARYASARRGDITSRGTVVDLFNRSLLSDFLPVAAMRGAGLWAMDRIGPLRRLFMREGLQPQRSAPRLMQGLTP